MSSIVYMASKAAGLSVALSVPVSDINITGLSVNARRLPAVVRELSDTVSVTTSFTIQVTDGSVAEDLSTTIAGAADNIKAATDSAMAAADWSEESVITAAPTMTAPAVSTPIVIMPPTPAPTPATPSPTSPATVSPTAPPTSGSAQATGDPHLTNVLGQHFDLHKEGWHTLVRVPRGVERGAALLSVEAEARQMGVACADLYFQSMNLTGRWVGSVGRVFSASRAPQRNPQGWLRYGKVELKVVRGHTNSGIDYLNLFVRHLKLSGYPVGGILGLDDHAAAAAPLQGCWKRANLLQIGEPANVAFATEDLER
jgi:hypothetical protein